VTQVVETDPDDEWAARPIHQVISVRQTEMGKVIDVNSMGLPDWRRLEPKMIGLMGKMGYQVSEQEDGSIQGVPTPETLRNHCQALGVDILLIPDTGLIEGSLYLTCFRDGKYPISTINEEYYLHDAGDDHLTGFILGGQPLKEALMTVASNALTKGEDEIKVTALGIDRYTATLRALIAPHAELEGEAYGDSQGRATLIKTGQEIGISEEVSLRILSETQKNGINFGIDPRQLN
jgi:hypothetical protein